MEVEISPVAYELLALHAVRFGAYQVDGLLLGPKEKGGGGGGGGGKEKKVVAEVLPLFHGPGPLAPLLEIALMQVQYIFIYI